MKKIKIGDAKSSSESPPTKTPRINRVARGNQEKPKKFITGKRIRIVAIAFMAAVLITAGLFVAQRWQAHIDNSLDPFGDRVADACTDILNPTCWRQGFQPQLKQANGKTNVLIAGIDTRDSGPGAGIANTDTILLATLEHSTGRTRMISFPRDLSAPWGCERDNMPFRIKINAVYANGRIRCQDKDPMEVLQYTIEKITGEEIQYYGLVRLDGLVQVVDELGGITVDVDPRDGRDRYVDAYPFIELSPERQQQCVRSRTLPAYCEFGFNRGPVEMDGELALIYSRMRMYSDDFDRGRRQQQVINGIKDKVLGQDMSTPEKARFIYGLYNQLDNLVEAEVNLEMILAGFALLGKVDVDPISVVLDPRFGGGGIVVGGGSEFNFTDPSFAQVQSRLAIIDDNYELFKDKARLAGINYTGTAWTNDNPMLQLRNDPNYRWILGEVITDTRTPIEPGVGIVIVDFTEGEMKSTLDWLKEAYSDQEQVTIVDGVADGLERSQFNEDIRVEVYQFTQSEGL